MLFKLIFLSKHKFDFFLKLSDGCSTLVSGRLYYKQFAGFHASESWFSQFSEKRYILIESFFKKKSFFQ